MVRMAQPVLTPQSLRTTALPARWLARGILLGAALLGSIILLGALALWFHYGTAVFFEMIAAGISACF
jgi:hypothetical protein